MQVVINKYTILSLKNKAKRQEFKIILEMKMFITELELYNFRNYAQQKVQFVDGLNIVCGKNAQGKTNLVEAIYLLSTGASPRAVSDKEMINLGAERARVSAKVTWDTGTRDVEMVLSKKEKKRASVNEMNIVKIGELLGNLNTVYFSPDEMSLIKDSPEYRRRFMDIDLCQLSRAYFYILNKYNKILKQRNALLKCENKKDVYDSLQIWSEQLSVEGAKIIKQRREFCKNISNFAKEIHGNLSGRKEELNISYSTSAVSEIESEIAKELFDGMMKNIDRDIRLGFTSVGAQRDDIKITLSNIDIRTYGSQGQQRTATLAMKLAEIEIFEKINGEKPILLLDDVLSELDDERQAKLIEKASSLQTIITCTNADKFQKKGKIFLIENGTVIGT